MRRQHKFNAKPEVVDGIRFASKREAKRYGELGYLLKAGEIRGLTLQPRFDLRVLSPTGEVVKVGHYTADFAYDELDKSESWGAAAWRFVVEDVKAPPSRTEAYMLRKRHVEAQYGIQIREV